MTEILIYGIVGGEWDGLDAKTLRPLITAGTDALDIRINSPGGYIVEGLAIYNALVGEVAKGRTVTCYIDGLAASMASIIAMAGTDIVMADNAMMMIHKPTDMAWGDAAELRAAADQLDRLEGQLIGIYAKRTGLAAEALATMLAAETWLNADEALEQKFITSIAGAVAATAQVNVSAFGFRKVPETPRISAMAMLGKPRAAAAVTPPQKESTMPQSGTAAAVIPAVETNASPASPGTATSVVALTAADLASASANAVTAERERMTGIQNLGAMATRHGLPASFTASMIADGTSLADARAKVLDKLAEVGDAANIGHTGGPVRITADESEKWQAGAQAWLLTRAGVAPMITAAAKLKGQTVDLNPGEFRGVSMVALAAESLARAGIREPSRDPSKIVGRAFTAKNEATQGTGDFTVLLENTLHKVLQAAYAVTPDTWSRFCGTGSVMDFRAHNRYLLGTFGTLDSLNELGEFKNKPIPDGAGERITASTKGNIIALSRQAIINDDLGAFSGLAVQFGRAAKLTVEVDVYAMLNSNPTTRDGFALFSAQHGNLVAAGTAPTIASVDAMRVAMASQTDPSGNEVLDIKPSVAVAPIGLGGALRVVNGSQYDPGAGGRLQVPNIVLGIFSDIVDTARLTGTPWYVFADKDMAPAIEVAFLNGVNEPFMDTDMGWRVDGTEWKVRLDYGVAPVNYRSAIKNPGA